jgi:hypothetical protein
VTPQGRHDGPVSVRLATLLAALLAVACLLPAAAPGDGDPASDVLLGENVFYPYQPPVSSALQKSLNAETAAAKRAGFPIKVALIASPVDLGVIPDLFGKPQKYADFLDQEISFQTKQPLLVVMYNGYGVRGLPPKSLSALASVPKPTGKASNDLATAAMNAVQKMANAAGHPLADEQSSSSGGGSSTLLIAVLAAVAVLTALVLAVVTVRRRRTAA